MPPKVLLVSLVPSFAYKVALCLQEVGATCHMVGKTRVPYGLISRYIKRSERLPTEAVLDHPHQTIAFLDAYCARHRVDVVMPTDYTCTAVLAAHGHGLRSARVMPLSSIDTLERVHDKWRFAQLLRGHGLPGPETRLLEEPADIEALDLPYPVMVKPLGLSDSLGVERKDDKEALLAHVRTGAWGKTLPLLVQRFVEGDDIDLNLLADHGEIVAWSIQRRQSYRNHALEFVDHERVLGLGRAIVKSSGFHGVGHIDLRVARDGDELLAIEFNPRYWGSVQYSAWAGVNFPRLVLEMALGNDPRPHFRPVRGWCENQGFSPVRLARCLARGRLAPRELSAASKAAWTATHGDPLPHVLRRAASAVESIPRVKRLGGG